MEKLILLTGFRSYLTGKLLPEHTDLPIDKSSMGVLVSKLGEGNYTYLTISDDRYYEIIKATLVCGNIILDRGVDGTTPRTFPCNAVVSFEIVPAVIRYMICNETCVECDCEPVKFAGSVLPQIKEGVAWEGSVVFAGSTPMTLGITNAPKWMKVTAGVNYLKLSGVPTSSAKVNISVGASNCGGELETVPLTLE